jgi:hypothetical protein
MTNSEIAGTRSENITRAEASERSDLISATSYEVVLGLTSTGPTFTTTTTFPLPKLFRGRESFFPTWQRRTHW